MIGLRGPLPAWDIERRRVDVERLAAFVLETSRALGVPARSLETLHEVVSGQRALDLCQALAEATLPLAGRALLHDVVRAAIPELPWDRVAIQVCAAVRILAPGDDVSPVPMHSDHSIGHTLDERNIWIALTPARNTAALHALSFAESMSAVGSRGLKGWFDGVRGAPLDVERGDVLLFTPLHVHGAAIVREPFTRVSIDVRIAPLESARARNAAAWIPLRPARACA